MNPITQAQLRKGRTNLATGKEITKQAVSKAVKQHKLTTCEVGGKTMIDLDGHLTVEWIRAHPIQAAAPPEPAQKPAPPTTPDPPPQKPQTPASAYLPQGHNPSGTKGHTGSNEEKKLKDENIELKNEKLRIENSQSRHELISKDLVITCNNELYAIDENQFKSLAVRAGPKIEESLAESYDGKTTEILELLGRIDDPDLKTDIQKIMNSGGSDRVRKITEIIEEDTEKVLKNIQRVYDRFLERCEQ